MRAGKQPAMTERTLCIVKPDAVEKRKAGAILAKLEEEGFEILALNKLRLTRPVAEGFYAVHKERPFFGELVEFMTRSPVVVAVLERKDAVAHYRKVMGATDPAKADAGTGYELRVIASVVIGGASLFGGLGGIGGAVVGALLIGVLTNGLVLANVSAYIQQIVIGLIIIIAVAFDTYAKSRLGRM